MKEYVISELKNLFRTVFGGEISSIDPIHASGSARRYYRIWSGKKSYIFCYSQNIKENETFINLTKFFKSKWLRVPEIMGVNKRGDLYILEDLGDRDLMSVIRNEERDEFFYKILAETIRGLVDFQFLPYEEWKNIVGFKPLGKDLIEYDFNYCIENFLKATSLKINLPEINREFKKLEEKLLTYPKKLWGLMYRDFQSRNIILYDEKPYFIDYQSSRFGPGIYDVVSFAWQAKAGFSNEERNEIVKIYCKALQEKGVLETEEVRLQIGNWAAFRIIQTLGAYGLRGLKEGKKHFIESIPPALNNLKALLENYSINKFMPEFYRIITEIGEDAKFLDIRLKE